MHLCVIVLSSLSTLNLNSMIEIALELWPQGHSLIKSYVSLFVEENGL